MNLQELSYKELQELRKTVFFRKREIGHLNYELLIFSNYHEINNLMDELDFQIKLYNEILKETVKRKKELVNNYKALFH